MLALLRFSWKASSRLQSPLLPQELIDQILDYLFDDVDALRSCSSVSPGWLDSARHHLFKEFSFVAKAGPNGASFAQFSVFLKESPSVCKHVRTLHLHGGSLSTTSVGAADSLAIPDFVCIVSSLPSLREVKLSRLSIVPEIYQGHSLPLNIQVVAQYLFSRTQLPPLPLTLHKLSLSQVSFIGDTTPLTISDFLRIFRCIDLLETWNVTAPPETRRLDSPILDMEDFSPNAPSIGSFRLERNSVRVQLCLLEIACMGSSRSLHTLDVHLDSSEDEEALQGLINAAGSALRNLSVNVMSKSTLPRTRVFDLSKTSLDVFTVSIPGPNFSDPHPMECLGDVLKTLITATVAPRELRLFYNVQRWPFSLEQIVSYKWRKIQITLLDMTPHVPEVVIVFYYAYMRGTVGGVEANFIRRELGLLDERGLLTIV